MKVQAMVMLTGLKGTSIYVAEYMTQIKDFGDAPGEFVSMCKANQAVALVAAENEDLRGANQFIFLGNVWWFTLQEVKEEKHPVGYVHVGISKRECTVCGGKTGEH